MEKLTITIKDDSKLRQVLNFLNKLDFVEVHRDISSSKSKAKKHDIFGSAGMWKNREVDANQLREDAWKRKS
jgi:hypothetical protein